MTRLSARRGPDEAIAVLDPASRSPTRSEEAIPILERRLQIPDQIDTVRRELAMAESEAQR